MDWVHIAKHAAGQITTCRTKRQITPATGYSHCVCERPIPHVRAVKSASLIMLAQSLSLTFFPKGKTAGTGPGPLPYLLPHREGQVEIGESNSFTYRKYIAHIKPLERGGDTEGICKKNYKKGTPMESTTFIWRSTAFIWRSIEADYVIFGFPLFLPLSIREL